MSTARKYAVADALFIIQIVGALLLGGSQFVRFLETTQGQLLSMFLLMQIYLGLHLVLALRAHQAQASRITAQAVAIYATWSVLLATNIAAFITHGFVWKENDTRLVIIIATGAAFLVLGAHITRVAWGDPMLKSLFAMLCKAVPQFVMAFEIARVGGAGLPGLAMVVGNITIILRIVQVALSVREAGWERNRAWLLASEVVNEASWAVVSIVWLMQTQ